MTDSHCWFLYSVDKKTSKKTVKHNFVRETIIKAQVITSHKFLFTPSALFSSLSCYQKSWKVTVFYMMWGSEICHKSYLVIREFQIAVSTGAKGPLLHCLSHNAILTRRSLHHNLILKAICVVWRFSDVRERATVHLGSSSTLHSASD